jgi:hypothetical protein
VIKKIYCFGTSHTKGAGFHLPQAKELYKDIVDNPSMESCSWPGIFKTYLKNDIEVINLSECGAGNERIYRLVFDLISNPKFNKDETLFLIETSNLGRKEFYSNTVDDYVICNFDTNNPSAGNFDVVKEYYKEEGNLPKDVKKKYRDFLIETTHFHSSLKRLQMNLLFFLNFLESYDINFELTSYDEEIFSPNQIKSFHKKYSGIKYNFDGKNSNTWYNDGYGGSKKYLFDKETQNIITDGHQGYWCNEIVAKTIYNHLIDKKWINGITKEIKSSHKDFLEFKKNLRFENFLI